MNPQSANHQSPINPQSAILNPHCRRRLADICPLTGRLFRPSRDRGRESGAFSNTACGVTLAMSTGTPHGLRYCALHSNSVPIASSASRGRVLWGMGPRNRTPAARRLDSAWSVDGGSRDVSWNLALRADDAPGLVGGDVRNVHARGRSRIRHRGMARQFARAAIVG